MSTNTATAPTPATYVVISLQDADEWFRENHSGSVLCSRPGQPQLSATCYPEALAYFGADTPASPAKDTNEGHALRLSAMRKIEQARTLLDSARHDLCNLEGPAKKPFYCDIYDKVGQHDRDLSTLTQRLREMPPPTGVFKI